jgi:hypothetical protein
MIRLIDLKTCCVVNASSARTYVCLSYVWGNAAIPKLRKDSYNKRYRKNSLQNVELGTIRIFADSFTLVKQLRFRYLWIDSLCILQDDGIDLGAYIPQMGDIYHNAALTAVRDSKDASTDNEIFYPCKN